MGAEKDVSMEIQNALAVVFTRLRGLLDSR